MYGYYKAHQLAGKLPWRELFKAAIKLCEDGFTVSKTLSSVLKSAEDLINASPSLAEIFINPKTMSVYQQGDVIKRPKYGNTLKNISENGYEVFYRGALTNLLVNEINQNGGEPVI